MSSPRNLTIPWTNRLSTVFSILATCQSLAAQSPAAERLHSEETNTGYVLKLFTQKPAYVPGEPMAISVVLTNTGFGTGEVHLQDTLAAYTFEVAYPSGTPCPLSKEGKRAVENANEWRHTLPARLKPGDSVTNTLDMSRLFEIYYLGRYTVRVARFVPSRLEPSKQVRIVSEPIPLVFTNRPTVKQN